MDLSLIHYYWLPGKVPGLEKCEGEFSEPEFLAEYHKHHSLPAGFEKRRDLYRLYDYLYRYAARNVSTTPSPKWRDKVLTMMKKLAQKTKTVKINVKIEKLLGGKYESSENTSWAYFKTRPFNYSQKTYNEIEIEINGGLEKI